MSFTFPIINETNPDLQLFIGMPDVKVKEVQEDDQAAINFARALIAEYQHLNGEKYHRILDGRKFCIDFAEKDPAMHEILMDMVLHGEYEPNTTKLVKEHVKPGDVCLDVGASIGYFTTLLAKCAGPTGKVIAIEATKNQFPYLQRNIEANELTNVEAHNVAASDTEEEILIQCNAGNVNKVRGIPLDTIVKVPIDFMKMDIDGSEPRALKGMIETIERSPKMKLCIEYYPEYIRRIGNDPDEFMAILDKYFDHQKIDGDYGDGYWNIFGTRK